ncbi:MAG: ATP-binding protein [Paludibacteraceae bacterium]|nr:ATP-binding protein [Paludibacteraceae bacterium]
MKIGIIGPESTGKSTLAIALARELKARMEPEYAREYVERLNRPYTFNDVCAIALHQIADLATTDDSEITVFDTELIITKVWFLRKYGTCPEWIEKAVQRYPMDIYLICAPDLPWQPDPVRENPHIRKELMEQYIHEVSRTRVPKYIISGTDADIRLAKALKACEFCLQGMANTGNN